MGISTKPFRFIQAAFSVDRDADPMRQDMVITFADGTCANLPLQFFEDFCEEVNPEEQRSEHDLIQAIRAHLIDRGRPKVMLPFLSSLPGLEWLKGKALVVSLQDIASPEQDSFSDFVTTRR